MRYQQLTHFPLFDRACQGDRDALHALIDFCSPCLRQVIGKLCYHSSHLEIDDLYQETWFLLLKKKCRVLRQWQVDKGEFGAFLFGVAAKVVRKHQHRQALHYQREISLTRLPATEFPVTYPSIGEVIGDLSNEASPAENRFLQGPLLRLRERNDLYSKTNRRQLTHRLLDKAWPLIYGPDVPRPHRKGRTLQPGAPSPRYSDKSK